MALTIEQAWGNVRMGMVTRGGLSCEENKSVVIAFEILDQHFASLSKPVAPPAPPKEKIQKKEKPAE